MSALLAVVLGLRFTCDHSFGYRVAASPENGAFAPGSVAAPLTRLGSIIDIETYSQRGRGRDRPKKEHPQHHSF